MLTVIALIAALATPLFQRALPGVEIKQAAEELRATMREARSIAIRDNRETVVLVNVATGVYARGDRRGTMPEGVQLDLLTSTRERIDGERGGIRFFADGTSTGGRVRLRRDDAIHVVEVDWFDGGVSIDDASTD